MGKQLAALAALVGACMLAAGCTNVVDGTAVAADKSGPLHQDPIPVSALEGLLLDLSQINAALGATSMKVWFNAKAMWDWSKSVADKNCYRRSSTGKGLCRHRVDRYARPTAG